MSDPARMVANLAGVAAGNDTRNDIVIRGNSPLGVQWRLDGFEIPNPNHFGSMDATGGPVSMLNNNQLANSETSLPIPIFTPERFRQNLGMSQREFSTCGCVMGTTNDTSLWVLLG